MLRFDLIRIACVTFRRAFTAIVLALVASSFLFGGSRAAKPVFLSLCVTLCAALLLQLFWQARHPVTATKRAKAARMVSTLELLGFNLALTLVLTEGLLRFLASDTTMALWSPNATDGFRLKPGHDYGDGLQGNSLGYPGREFERTKSPSTLRIAALGDSFAIGPAVPFSENYLTLLEKELPGTEVYNFGVSGAGPREYLLNLQRHAFHFQPDLVLVSIFVGNDITETLALPRNLDVQLFALHAFASRGIKVLRNRQARMAEPMDAAPGRCQAGTMSLEAFREVEARRLAICRLDLVESMERKWKQAFACLENLVTACRQRRTPLAVVLIPDELQVNPEVRIAAVRDAGANPDQIDLTLPQRRLQAFFVEREVPCLDLHPAFQTRPGTYAPRDTHWNVDGNRLAAAQIAPWLRGIRGRTPSRLASAPPAPAP